jgi:hypothetical protein
VEYASFISYSHADEKVARWLHRKLESYRMPRALVGREGRRGLIRRQLGKVFRDRDEFAAGGDLTAQIRDALERSAALIVLCSPRSAASRYVALEIETFRALSPNRPIIPVILEGEPSECYPEPLLKGNELLGADLRPGRDEKEAGLLRLLAGLHGVAFDELVQRERVAQRLRMSLASGAAVLFAGLAVIAVVLAVSARRNSNLAERRAALMSIDSARRELAESNVDRSLLILLDAARVLRDAPPDALLIAFQDALSRAASERQIEVGEGARLFATSRGVYAARGDSGEVHLIQSDGTLKRVASGEVPARAVLAVDDPALIVVRDDFTIERHDGAGGVERLGSFECPGASRYDGGSDIELVAPDLLLWQPEWGSQTNDSPDCWIQIFDLAALKLRIIPTDTARPVNYARLDDGRRVVFDTFGFVADIDFPPVARAATSHEERSDPSSEFPDFLPLSELSCLAAQPPESMREAFRKALSYANAGDNLRFSCRRTGDSVLIYTETSTSAGIDRQDALAYEDEARRLVVPADNDAVEPPSLTWTGVSHSGDDVYALALAVGRRVRLISLHGGDVLMDRSFGYPIRFGGFLPDGKLLLLEDGRTHARLIDYERRPFGERRLDGDVDNVPATALHPVACRGRPYRGVTSDGATLTVEADEVPESTDSDLTFRVSITSAQTRFEKRFTAYSDQRCIAIAEGGRYLAIGGSDNHMQIHDLHAAREGRPSQIGEFEAGAAGDPHTNTWSTIFFVGSGPTVIAASGGDPVWRWEYAEATRRWNATEIYRSAFPIRSAEPDATGQRLLLKEDLDHGQVSARIYSLEAGRTWLDMGRDYKWLFAVFNANNEAMVAMHDRWISATRMISIEDAIQAARDGLSSQCGAFENDNFRSSPCWPKTLGE